MNSASMPGPLSRTLPRAMPSCWRVVTVMLPLVLEWTGVLNQSYAVTAGVVIASSDTFEMNRPIDEGILVATNLLFIVSAGVVAVFISRRRLSAQRQLQIQAWHLRQLLPTAKRWQTQPKRRRTIGG